MTPLRDVDVVPYQEDPQPKIGDHMTATAFENWLDEQPDSWSIDCPVCGAVHGVIAEDCFQDGETLLS